MLFPAIGPQYYNEKDRGILNRMEIFYADSISINQVFWGEADIDTRFECNDQTLWNDLYANLPANRRRQFNFNHIRPIINMISGYQRRNRMSTIVIPVENGDAQTADQFTKILLWLNKQEGVLETISESFHGSLVTGMNLLQVWIDYRSDPISGNIKVDNCPYNSFLIDPFFRKSDLSDCRAIWKRSMLSKRECISLLPDMAREIIGLEGLDARDGKFQFIPESYNYGVKNLLTYDEFYYRDYRKQKMLVDTQTGETLEWRSNNDEGLRQFLNTYPQVTVIEQDIPTVHLAIVVQGKVMYDGPNPLGIDSYPFVPVFSYYNPQLPYFPYRVQGVVRSLRDAQFLYNRRKAIELDILESQINSGWIYKENALVNPRDVFLSGQGRGLALKEEAQMTDVQQIQSPAIPPTTIELSKIMSDELNIISGVNNELLGSAIDDKSGILSMLRQGAGLTTLQGLFDNLDRAQKILGKICIDLIQANFTPGKVKKILEGEEPTAQFYNEAFGTYHAAIEEGLNTTTQRQMQFAQMLQLREAGVPIPDDMLLESATLQNKSKLIERMTQQAEVQQQMQQQQQQIQMQEAIARVQLAQARAIADQGLGVERVSRVEENRALAVERRSEAEKNRHLGILDFVKALKELDTIDITHVEKLINLSTLVKAHDDQVQNREEASVAQAINPSATQQPIEGEQPQSSIGI